MTGFFIFLTFFSKILKIKNPNKAKYCFEIIIFVKILFSNMSLDNNKLYICNKI